MIGNVAIAVYVGMLILGLVAPSVLAFVWVKKTKQPFFVILIGAAIFFLFAIVLESLPKLVFFQTNNPIGKFVMSNTLLYMTIAALLAGIFEETGRFMAFKVILKKQKERLTAITYGIGHGGFEVMFLLAMGGVQSLVYIVMINSGQFDTILAQVAATAPEQLETLEALPQALSQATFVTLALSAVERVSAVLIHISCSILMFRAVREEGKLWLYPVAMLLHASIDMIPAMYQVGILTNLYLIELLLLIWGLAMFTVCFRFVYKKMPVTY